MYDKLEIFLSKEKLEAYVAIANDKEKALDLYKDNLNISAYLYKLIQVFELSTRNIFNVYLSKRYGNDWINRNDILTGNNNKNERLLDNIKHAKRDNKIRDNNDIISNLSLGFWVNLLSFKNNDKIWKTSIKKLFNGYSREEIQKIFRNIKEFRNRIAHHETIINKNYNELEQQIFLILKIYSNDLYEWTKNITSGV